MRLPKYMIPTTKRYGFIRNTALTTKQIRLRLWIFNAVSIFFVLLFVYLFIRGCIQYSYPSVFLSVVSIVISFIVKVFATDLYEISLDNYATLQSHKQNVRVRDYIQVISASGRKFVTRQEYDAIIHYCNNHVPYQASVEKLFDPEEQ